jgi:hypothetical protein
MLLRHGTQAEWRELAALPGPDAEGHAAFMNEVSHQLHTSGELVSGVRLAGPDRARVVRARTGAAPAVLQAPFPEDRPFMFGCWVLDCDSPERIREIAARLSAAPGRGGAPLNAPVEVRQVMRGRGEEM